MHVLVWTLAAACCVCKVYHSCVQGGMLAMCFDDDPTENTQKLLQALDEHEVEATFHVGTANLTDEAVRGRIKNIFDAGHLVGIKIDEEYSKRKDGVDDIKRDIANKADEIKEITGKPPRYVRCLENTNPDVIEAIAQLDMILSTHSLDSKDYMYKDSSSSIAREFDRAFRLSSPKTRSFISVQRISILPSIEAIPKIVESAAANGYRPVRLDKCCGEKEEYKPRRSASGKKGSSLDTEMKEDSATVVSSIVIPALFYAFILL